MALLLGAALRVAVEQVLDAFAADDVLALLLDLGLEEAG